MLKGRFTISRMMNPKNARERSIRVELEDELSGVHVVEIALTLNEFALALMGQAMAECEFETYDNADLIGKMREIRTETIAIPYEDAKWRMTPAEMEPLISAQHFDNWRLRGRWDAAIEGRISKDKTFIEFQVSFVRWVKETK